MVLNPKVQAQPTDLLKTAAPVISAKQNTKPDKNKKTSATVLATLKAFENGKNWKECVRLSPIALKEEPTVAGWILATWLNCARQSAGVPLKGVANNMSLGVLANVLARVDKSPQIFLDSSARKSLREELWRTRTLYVEWLLRSADKKQLLLEAENQIQLLSVSAQDKEQRARLLAYSGDLASLNHNASAAETFLLQSLELSDSKSVRDRLASVQLALLRKKTEDSTKQLNADKGKGDGVSESEQKFIDRISVSAKNADLISVLQDAVVYVNTYPNGKKTKWAMERILEIYLSLSEDKADKTAHGEKNDERSANLKQKALASMERLEVNRVYELARSLHKKNDYWASQRLAERALVGLNNSAQSAALYYVAGRSAHFLGDYKVAQKHFVSYIEWNSAAEDSAEVNFRLGLVYLRLANFSSAIATFERLLASSGSDKFELGARYWLIRALQATKNPRVDEETKKLIEKFPFSYYGLKLRAESSNLQLEPFADHKKNSAASEAIWLTTYQKQNWDRVLLLGRNGWIGEAYQEILDFSFPLSAAAKIKMAKDLCDNHIYWSAIKLTNEALDLDPQLRAADNLSLGFPRAYEAAIQAESERYHLSHWLVRSLIRQESAYNERATSVSKAMGLMQLIPPTAQEVAKELGLTGLDLPEDSYRPEINLQMGTSYVARMIKQFGGNVPMGLAAYNAGPAKMQLFVKARPEVEVQMSQYSSEPLDEIWFDELPWSETSFYVKAILRNTILYRLLILKEGAPALILNKVLWSDLAPDLRSSPTLDVSPDSRGPTTR